VDRNFVPAEGDPDNETSLPAPLWDDIIEEYMSEEVSVE
jgi:hypothetical protein